MQHSPQEIKTRLDKAVDPEGNVVDMVAVLELVTTLERLPLTREALETTRIGKTINLLRKKTNNEDLAKRAKKLVKKWQKLVINQIEASRSIDSPLNGSRISPQINGTIRDNKSSSNSLIDKTVKSKKGLKRKRSTSSLDNSPLTLQQDSMSPCTASDNSSNPSSPFPLATELHVSPLKQPALISDSKKPKLMDDGCKGRNGATVHHEQLQPTKSPVSECDGKNNVNNTHVSSNKDVHTIVNKTPDIQTSNKTSNLQENNFNQSLDSIGTDSGVNSLESSLNTCSYSTQHTPDQEIESNNSNSMQSNLQQQFENEIESKDNHIKKLVVKNGTSVSDSEMVDKLNDVIDTTLADNENSLSDKEQTHEQSQESGISISESRLLENVKDTSKPFTPDDSEKMDVEPLEPKELVLDLNKEANGINGRFNDQGMWFSWTDTMPNNDGQLNILPYVILD